MFILNCIHLDTRLPPAVCLHALGLCVGKCWDSQGNFLSIHIAIFFFCIIKKCALHVDQF